MARTCIAAMVIIAAAMGPWHPAFTESLAGRPPEGRLVAFSVPRGESGTLMTEIWTGLEDRAALSRIRTYLGAPGDLWFAPSREELLYLERSLQRQVFCPPAVLRKSVRLARNRIWRLRQDGTKERKWPLPPDFSPLGFAPARESDRLVVRGHKGAWVGGGESGLWVVNGKGTITQVFQGSVVEILGWSEDETAVSVRIAEGDSEAVRSVSVASGEGPAQHWDWTRADAGASSGLQGTPDAATPIDDEVRQALNQVHLALGACRKTPQLKGTLFVLDFVE